MKRGPAAVVGIIKHLITSVIMECQMTAACHIRIILPALAAHPVTLTAPIVQVVNAVIVSVQTAVEIGLPERCSFLMMDRWLPI